MLAAIIITFFHFSEDLPLFNYMLIVSLSPYPHPYPTPPLQDVRSVETGNLSCFICQDISPVSRAEVGI